MESATCGDLDVCGEAWFTHNIFTAHILGGPGRVRCILVRCGMWACGGVRVNVQRVPVAGSCCAAVAGAGGGPVGRARSREGERDSAVPFAVTVSVSVRGGKPRDAYTLLYHFGSAIPSQSKITRAQSVPGRAIYLEMMARGTGWIMLWSVCIWLPLAGSGRGFHVTSATGLRPRDGEEGGARGGEGSRWDVDEVGDGKDRGERGGH